MQNVLCSLSCAARKVLNQLLHIWKTWSGAPVPPPVPPVSANRFPQPQLCAECASAYVGAVSLCLMKGAFQQPSALAVGVQFVWTVCIIIAISTIVACHECSRGGVCKWIWCSYVLCLCRLSEPLEGRMENILCYRSHSPTRLEKKTIVLGIPF